MDALKPQLLVRHEHSPSSGQLTILLIVVFVICSLFKGNEVCTASLITTNSQALVDTLSDIRIHFTYELNKDYGYQFK